MSVVIRTPMQGSHLPYRESWVKGMKEGRNVGVNKHDREKVGCGMHAQSIEEMKEETGGIAGDEDGARRKEKKEGRLGEE